jgi:16S rRNA (cytidine1402-2'-O)-methyltransferase
MTLFVVATPIGNLADITKRAVEVLGRVNAVVAEDSRRTRALLTHLGISKPIVSMPAFDERHRAESIVKRLVAGEELALCTDAGTPAISDPGTALVAAAISAGQQVIPIPGPSAVIAALSVCGFDTSRFLFLGFLPRTPAKKRRELEAAIEGGVTTVVYETAIRLPKLLALLAEVAPDRMLMVGRELTKLYETLAWGMSADLQNHFRDHPAKGECTVVIAQARK